MITMNYVTYNVTLNLIKLLVPLHEQVCIALAGVKNINEFHNNRFLFGYTNIFSLHAKLIMYG